MTARRQGPRLDQLLSLARAGDEAAISDLWAEYGIDYALESDPRDRVPTHPLSEASKPNTKEK